MPVEAGHSEGHVMAERATRAAMWLLTLQPPPGPPLPRARFTACGLMPGFLPAVVQISPVSPPHVISDGIFVRSYPGTYHVMPSILPAAAWHVAVLP